MEAEGDRTTGKEKKRKGKERKKIKKKKRRKRGAPCAADALAPKHGASFTGEDEEKERRVSALFWGSLLGVLLVLFDRNI